MSRNSDLKKLYTIWWLERKADEANERRWEIIAGSERGGFKLEAATTASEAKYVISNADNPVFDDRRPQPGAGSNLKGLRARNWLGRYRLIA